MTHPCCKLLSAYLAAMIAVSSGCTQSRYFAAGVEQPPSTNGVFLASANHEAVWEHVVGVLHDYQFAIARENKLDGVIETDYKVGSGLLEPWHHDSVGFENRFESSLQSIRRRVVATVTPTDGGHVISFEAYRELEDLAGLAANSAGGATFQESTPLQRDLNLVVGQTAPSGWIPQGRDLALEQALLQRLQQPSTR